VAPIKDKGQLYSDSQAKAELLNWQFKSVFTQENTDEPLPKITGKEYTKINRLDITIAGVQKLLANLNTNKASGSDGLPDRIMKTCAVELAPAITDIYKRSLTTGTLPSDRRNANVSPIFKKGNKHEASNYRPVSLTSVCCILLEHIICIPILKHLENNSILIHLQHGFRSGHSCESQLIITLNDIMKNFDSKIQTDLIILDFSKTFDTEPHRKLLHKLNHYGIDGILQKWLSAFLSKREQRVIVEGEFSSSVKKNSGL
jgi:hypothetical protein